MTKIAVLKPKRRLALAATVSAVGLLLGAAAPASAAVTFAIHAGTDYSQARTWSTNGSSGSSWARHGSLYVSTGYSTSYTNAYADSGTSSTYGAGVRLNP
ncbi:MAG: hypothetical protein QM677_01895 [Microbacterium sp.]